MLLLLPFKDERSEAQKIYFIQGHTRAEPFLQPRVCVPEHRLVRSFFTDVCISEFLSCRDEEKSQERVDKKGIKGRIEAEILSYSSLPILGVSMCLLQGFPGGSVERI